MKNFPFILIFLGLHWSAFAQKTLFSLEKPFIIAQAGMGYHMLSDAGRVCLINLEHPFSPTIHAGLSANFYLGRTRGNYYYYYGGSYLYYASDVYHAGREFGAYIKFFLHGRFSGRKSGIFLGPELRAGKRRVTDFLYFNYLDPANPPVKTAKILLLAGRQWRFRHAVLELGCPAGFERQFSKIYYGSNFKVIFMPYLQLGIAL